MKRRHSEPNAKRPRWLGALLAFALVGLVTTGMAYGRARAQLGEGLMDLGAQMLRYSDAIHQDSPRDLVLNGQVLRLMSGTSARGAAEVLDHFEARCSAADGSLMEQIDALQAAHPEVEAGNLAAPVLREDDGLRGYVACLDLGPSSVSIQELRARLHRYTRSGNVAEIGEARFVFVEQSGDDDARRTHFVTMWSTGTFNLDAMFPRDGDVPGHDVEDVERPPNARRILQGFERGQPQSLTIYDARGTTESDLERFYRRTLPDAGWTIVEDPNNTSSGSGPTTLVAERGPRTAIVVLQTDLRTGYGSAAVFDAR